jgi:RNA polymerase sigma factor (sigma-70 family)
MPSRRDEHSDDPARAAEYREHLQHLVIARARLSPRQNLIIDARFWGDRSYREIAQELGIGKSTVASDLRSAFKMLAAFLAS